MTYSKQLVFTVCFIIISKSLWAQIEDPVNISSSFERLKNNQGYITIKASIPTNWHIYSQFLEEGGPEPTILKFKTSESYKLKGGVSEFPIAITTYDDAMEVKIAWHKNEVVFKQLIQLNESPTVIKGHISYMACTDEKCLPSTEKEFAVEINTPLSEVKVNKGDGEEKIVLADSTKEESISSITTTESNKTQDISPKSNDASVPFYLNSSLLFISCSVIFGTLGLILLGKVNVLSLNFGPITIPRLIVAMILFGLALYTLNLYFQNEFIDTFPKERLL